MTKKSIFILGAPDPEMNTIEGLLLQEALPVAYATVGGNRVHPSNATRADGVVALPKDQAHMTFYQARVVLVECRLPEEMISGADEVVVVDHHAPGDPGFGKGPEDYWEASSIGQVCDLIGVDPTEQLRLVAAADHCLGAAYRGLCPGVTSSALRKWRAESKAVFQGVEVQEVHRKVDAALRVLEGLPEVTLQGAVFRDARGQEIPELPEASAIAGTPVLYSLEDKRSGRTKVGVLNGTPEEIRAFLDSVEELGLVDPYGDPARGFAGAYQP